MNLILKKIIMSLSIVVLLATPILNQTKFISPQMFSIEQVNDLPEKENF